MGSRSRPDQVGVEGGGGRDQGMKKAAISRLVCAAALLGEKRTAKTPTPLSVSDFPRSFLTCCYASLVCVPSFILQTKHKLPGGARYQTLVLRYGCHHSKSTSTRTAFRVLTLSMQAQSFAGGALVADNVLHQAKY